MPQIPNCTNKSVVYKNVYHRCVPKAREDKEVREEDLPREQPAIYVGESSRTIMERSWDHWSFYRGGEQRKPHVEASGPGT